MRQSHQKGSVVLVQKKSGNEWRFRFRENGVQRSEFLGTTKQFPSKSHAEKAADRLRRRLNTNIEVITVADLIAKFWQECPPDRETTAASYRSIFGRIESEWGKFRLDAMAAKTAEIKSWLDTLETHLGKKASPLYRGQVKTLLHLLFEKAILWNHLMLDRNPMDVVRLKGSSRRVKEIHTLTADQYRALLDDPELPLLVKTIIQVAGGLGLRISEILGLRWDDFDFEKRTVYIRRSVVRSQKYATKTSGSTRRLPVHDSVIQALMIWKNERKVVKGWLFGSERTGMPYDRDSLRDEYLQPAGERIGVDGLGWHSFRHSYRSMMREAGVALEDQRNLMRHSRLATTVDTYGGEDDAERLRAANDKVVSILMGRTA